MIDRDITISNLEINIRWIEDNPQHQFPGWGNVTMAMRDAVELLKEQPEIVRCKDCMYNSISDSESLGQCLIQYGWFPARPDWFCADGKKRNDDDD